MGNSLLIKGSDFSNCLTGKFNIQKLSFSKDGNGAKVVTSDVISDLNSNYYNANEEMAHSTIINLPSGTKYIYGKINCICRTDDFQTYLSDPTIIGVYNYSSSLPCFVFHRGSNNSWGNIAGFRNPVYSRPRILGYKSGLYKDGAFTVVLIEGGIYGTPLVASALIDQLIFNWVRTDSLQCPELGLTVPELYAGF